MDGAASAELDAEPLMALLPVDSLQLKNARLGLFSMLLLSAVSTKKRKTINTND